MAGIIEKHAHTEIKLRQRRGIFDGKPLWGETDCLCMVLDFTSRDRTYFGTVQNGKVFLVAPFGSAPALPGVIVFDGREYEIKSIKTYRNLRGVLVGYRMVAAGA